MSAAFRVVLHRLFKRIARGSITVRDRSTVATFGRSDTGPSVTVTVHDSKVYLAALRGSVGIAESYIAGHWSCDDLAGLVRIVVDNPGILDGLDGGIARAAEIVRFAASLGRRNTRRASRADIAAHYDLSNELFASFLGPTMTYSSALFERENASLEEAQISKLESVCRRLGLGPQDHLLEIGTGWGGFAIHAARRYGCRVTTTTISREQFEFASERVTAAGVADRVKLLLCDYRDLVGKFSKIASIEMIEAVGHANLERYFRVCKERLAPGGRLLVQAISIAEPHHARHLSSIDFIKAYIFPGSAIPSLSAMIGAAERVGLSAAGVLDMTLDYAKTLRVWRSRFVDQATVIRSLGFDDAFIRKWEYYFAYCEGAFQTRYLGASQLSFLRAR